MGNAFGGVKKSDRVNSGELEFDTPDAHTLPRPAPQTPINEMLKKFKTINSTPEGVETLAELLGTVENTPQSAEKIVKKIDEFDNRLKAEKQTPENTAAQDKLAELREQWANRVAKHAQLASYNPNPKQPAGTPPPPPPPSLRI